MRASAFVIFARGTRGDTGRPERDLARPPVCLLSAFSWRKIGEDFFFQAVSNPPRCMACVMTFSVLLCLRVAGGWTAEREIGSPADGDLDQVKQVHGTHAKKHTREWERERRNERARESFVRLSVCVGTIRTWTMCFNSSSSGDSTSSWTRFTTKADCLCFEVTK